MKLFSTRAHGVLDYLTVAALPTIPRVLGWNHRTCRILDTAAASVLAYSLLTNYELGVKRTIPMKGHLAADALWGLAMCAAPTALNERNGGARALMVGMGLFSLFASQTTENYSPLEMPDAAAGEPRFHPAPRFDSPTAALPA
jgi:hypothetical protein